MIRLSRLFDLTPMDRPGDSAAAYVPLVMAARGLSFIRTFAVASILGAAGEMAFGLYQPAIELINPLVALVLFGSADVSERFFSRVEHKHGPGAARRWAGKQAIRVLLIGIVAGLALALNPWMAGTIWGMRQPMLLALCAITMLVLALYQHLLSTLRGARAYAAAAGMEIISAVLFLGLSIAAATTRRAEVLILGYAASILFPYALYAALFWLRPATGLSDGTSSPSIVLSSASSSPAVLSYATPVKTIEIPRFAIWSLVRLLLVMLFGFLPIWGVRYLGDSGMAAMLSGVGNPGLYAAAHYAVPLRIAQLLAFLALTLWSSSYGIAARAWSQGRRRQARLQYFRVGRLGFAALLALAVLLVLSRGYLAQQLPNYAGSISAFTAPMAGIFLWYALASFGSSFADLQERPERGAALWGVVVLVLGMAIAYAQWRLVWRWPWVGAEQYVLTWSIVGLGAALLLIGPWIMGWHFPKCAAGLPLTVMALSVVSFFAPAAWVDYLVPLAIGGLLLLLLVSDLLLRPYDRRAMRRWFARHFKRAPLPA